MDSTVVWCGLSNGCVKASFVIVARWYIITHCVAALSSGTCVYMLHCCFAAFVLMQCRYVVVSNWICNSVCLSVCLSVCVSVLCVHCELLLMLIHELWISTSKCFHEDLSIADCWSSHDSCLTYTTSRIRAKVNMYFLSLTIDRSELC